ARRGSARVAARRPARAGRRLARVLVRGAGAAAMVFPEDELDRCDRSEGTTRARCVARRNEREGRARLRAGLRRVARARCDLRARPRGFRIVVRDRSRIACADPRTGGGREVTDAQRQPSQVPDWTRLPLDAGGRSLIEASAGTGKTWTIAVLYLRLLLEEA